MKKKHRYRYALPGGKKNALSPAKIILGGFGFVILLGTGLLMLPLATRSGRGAPFVDALFTATSATCVTGLVLHDTWQFWSPFGQAVILLLIQIGGMGVITMTILAAILAGRKIGLRQRWLMQESISAPQMGGIVHTTRFLIQGCLVVELLGAALLFPRFIERYPFWQAVWHSVFHAVSAFCNAGFDLMGAQGEFSSLTGFYGDGYLTLIVTLLIIVGGLGFLTWQDMLQHRFRLKRYCLQSKVILATTGVLLALPFLFYFFYEFALPQWSGLTLGQRFTVAWFQTVTPRTAGFNTVDLALMSGPGKLLMICLMLVGGSPGSTAGGFKTTTLAVQLLVIRAVFINRSNVTCFKRRLSRETLRNACAVFMLYLSLFLVGGTAISMMNHVGMMEALFESASAIGTVGLSLGLTPTLNHATHLLLVAMMFLGRVGGLTMIYAMTDQLPPVSEFPEERISVG